MRFRIPRALDGLLDLIAFVLFPPPKRIGLTIAGHTVTLVDLALAAYTLAIGIGLWLWLGSWLWLLVTIVSMIMAAMIFEWML